jgi:lipopolysaccharide heptosyltransferase II
VSEKAAWQAAERVLCVRLDGIGDLLMTTPALRAVKTSRPGRQVVLLTSSAAAGVAALVPEVDEIFVYDPPWMKATPPLPDAAGEYAMAERLRAARLDAAVIFTVFSQNPLPAALLCWLAGVPRRLAHCRENPYQLLTDWVRDPEPEAGIRHEVRRQLDLVAAVDYRTMDQRLSLAVPHAAYAAVDALLAGRGVRRDEPWVLIHPGASAPSRRYPPEHFAAVGRALARDLGYQVIFAGSAAERTLVDTIRAHMAAPSTSVAGELDLARLAALIARAPLLIANNSGPMHMAAALGTPVASLYALTNPQHTPWQVPSRVLSHDVPCRNCFRSICPMGHHNCLRLVPPEAVVGAAAALLAEVDPAAGRHDPCE